MKAFDDDVAGALDTLRKGGIILYPTETVWGIGCDATNSEAVKKVFQLKKRLEAKALITLVSDLAMLERHVEDVPEIALQLIEQSDRPITIVYDNGRGLAPELYAPDGSVGLRLTNHPYCLALCRGLKKPIVSTSANISGEPTPSVFHQISPEIIQGVDYAAQPDTETHHNGIRRPSSVVKISRGGIIKILRP